MQFQALIVMAFLFAASCFGAAPLENVPQSRLDHLSNGANVCLWFRFPHEESTNYFSNYISDNEAALMRKMGLSHVRLCIHPKRIMDPATGAVREDCAKYVDAAIRRFQRAGLLVVVDIHNEERPVELDPAWQEAFVRFWGAFSKRMSQFPAELTMLEVINEPVFLHRESEWDTLNGRLVKVIRENAPQHTIMVSGPDWGGIDGLLKLKPLADKNLVYSFHCYDPFPFTHQGATWAGEDVKPLRNVPYPSSPEAVTPLLTNLSSHPSSKAMVEAYGKERWDRNKLASRFKQAVDWGLTNKVPLYCGEFGVFPQYARAEDRAAWFRDFGAILKENHIGWAVWGWDEGFGLNRTFVNGKPVVDAAVAKALGLEFPL